jgi:ferrochelatase
MEQVMKKAILLLNMGGPSSPDEVKLFLHNMFNDRRIIHAPKPIRWLISKIIIKKRLKEAVSNYEKLGGISPIIGHTKNLVNKLSSHTNVDVFMVMRYTPPFAADVLKDLKEHNEIYAIPLYPQHSSTTTLSSFDDLFKSAKKLGIKAKIHTISHFAGHDLYIDSIVERIKEAIGDKDPGKYELLFSAHGLPQKMINKGDMYQKHIKQTLYHVRKALLENGMKFAKTHLAYQSRLGPIEWTKPYMDEKLKTLVGKNVLVFPIAFTIDNSETEYELDIEYRHLAKEVGIKEYIVAKAPNDSDKFVECLTDIYDQMRGKNDRT